MLDNNLFMLPSWIWNNLSAKHLSLTSNLANSLFVQQFYKSTKKLGQETRSPIQLWFSPITNTYKQQCERLSTTCLYWYWCCGTDEEPFNMCFTLSNTDRKEEKRVTSSNIYHQNTAIITCGSYNHMSTKLEQ